MRPERWQLVKAVLEEVLEAEEDERKALLSKRCADDPDLRKEVEALLEADEKVTEFLEPETLARPGVLSRGEEVGPYHVLRRIGEGGMGEVYEAEQAKPVRRRVAMKLIKLGMDTRQVIARFDTERQALALMSHPSIARVFDAGTTEKGRPYFVMEYVPGVSVTEYCDTNHLGTLQRLELFIQICEGVHHAHQKGIIHRDIKPSNVLVTLVDGKPVPKIIDFGVAKATAQRLTEATFYTELGQAIGTPEYMSPEQTEVTGIDIDTRTDVYSLGILLYELLTGARPFDFRAKGLGFDEMRRRIREEEPTRPSTRARELSQTSPEVARNRHTDPGTLVSTLRGDLDWITLKALEKDRARRYGSVSELAADIQRHLDHRPVVAGPSSTTYRIGKFVRRHRMGVAAASVVALALVLGLAAATVGLVRAQRAEVAARQAEARALQEAETAQQVSDFLVDLFEVSDPRVTEGESLTAREILDRGAADIERELVDQPLIQARLKDTMSRVYHKIGLYPEADSLGRQALETRERLLGARHADVATSLQNLGTLHRKQGDYEEAESLHRRALDIRESVLEKHDPLLAETLNSLAIDLAIQGDLAQAEVLLERAVDIREHVFGKYHPTTAVSVHDLAVIYARQGDNERAEPLFLRLMESGEKNLAPDHPLLGYPAVSLAIINMRRSELEKAERYIQIALRVFEKSYGSDHPEVANALHELANLRHHQGRDEEAETVYLRALDIRERLLGGEHIEVAETLEGLARLHEDQGRGAEAERLYKRALQIREKALGAGHPSVMAVAEPYAGLLRRAGRGAEAASLLARLEAARE
jgi:serine/threonine protein kinase/tetratricopeptide (TPR) repeat protein